MIRKSLGGDRLGSGAKMDVELHGYERSNHDLSYLWRSTMSAGTLVPFMSELALPGDTHDINLNCDVKTHPTIGPLFGSYKVQLDVFSVPLRLYNGLLHNNKLGVGRQMQNVMLPQISWNVPGNMNLNTHEDPDNAQINPSCLLSYLGLRGLGNNETGSAVFRAFNGTKLVAYWDIIKNYYANKMETYAYVIHSEADHGGNISAASVRNGATIALPSTAGAYMGQSSDTIVLEWQNPVIEPKLEFIIFKIYDGLQTRDIYALELANWTEDTVTNDWVGRIKMNKYPQIYVYSWRFAGAQDSVPVSPKVVPFSLSILDDMRENLLKDSTLAVPVDIFSYGVAPYDYLAQTSNLLMSQEGLAVKTYQSDKFNNWLDTAYVDSVNTSTAISTVTGSFTIDQLNLSNKLYELLTRVNVSGGTYDDYIETVYDVETFGKPEIPMYMGGLIKELVFQEVISNSQSTDQPLGTLGGRGVLSKKHKGGSIVIKTYEPSYIIGIISLTPRLDYSQGNKWDMHLKSYNDFHKPQLDQIGFQDLIEEEMAWWTTEADVSGWTQKTAGKQPAWINYMTNVNETRGNFAIASNEMFMTLNRRYQFASANIGDLTTYIDPVKYNNIFAETALDAQNFWVQISVDIFARRKMSSKVIPNL